MIGGSLPERKKHGYAVRLVCSDTSVQKQRGVGGRRRRGEKKKSSVCMHSRSFIKNIINKHNIVIIIFIGSSDVGDVSKSPGDGDFFRLVLV